MPTFRLGFIVGASLAIAVALLLGWHWQPERQARLHSEHLIQRVQAHAWTSISTELAADYRDQWSNDRAAAVAALRELMTALRGVEIVATPGELRAADRDGTWSARIALRGGNEYSEHVVARVNALQTPFTFRWRKQSAKPWDWQLVSVEQPELDRIDPSP